MMNGGGNPGGAGPATMLRSDRAQNQGAGSERLDEIGGGYGRPVQRGNVRVPARASEILRSQANGPAASGSSSTHAHEQAMREAEIAAAQLTQILGVVQNL